jgi:hypothetical protein
VKQSPQRLYKYASFNEQSLRNLKTQSVYFNSPENFNDPYDCALFPLVPTPSITQSIEMRDAYIHKLTDPAQFAHVQSKSDSDLPEFFNGTVKKVMDDSRGLFKTQGISCFSSINDQILMWSHYAASHTGFCLAFDTRYDPFCKAKEVTYADLMPTVDPYKLLIEKNYEEVLDLFSTKALAWRYEQEWRIRCKSMNVCIIYRDEALTDVFFGSRMRREAMEIVYLILKDKHPGIRYWQGRRSTSEFKIEFDAFRP